MSAPSLTTVLYRPVIYSLVALCVLIISAAAGHGSHRTLYFSEHLSAARYQLRVADTPAERSKGLGGVRYLTTDNGMLFIYPRPSKACFWMQDMHVALDIIWLDSRKRIVHMVQNITPDTYPQTYCSAVAAHYVIELPAGAAARTGLETGRRLSF